MTMVVKIGDRKVFVGLIDLLTIGMLVIALSYVVIIGIRHPATTYFDRPDIPRTAKSQSMRLQSAFQPSVPSITQQTPAVTYLHIKEWGVRLPLPAGIKDVYYVPGESSVGHDGTTNQIYLGLKSLDAYGCAADGSNHGNDSAVAMIFRASQSDTDPVSGKPYSQVFPGVTLGNYFYGYENVAVPDGKTCRAPKLSLESADSALVRSEKSVATYN